ncbi:MAG TPA: glutathione S-transferase family protein [Alphaproteobacteria bacterium]|nr:glutathione S-transferase family protein [Alphaproteobacteria bacterium]
MIRLLGRATSGNVQKVIFFLEEARIPYKREDYGRQFNNTQTDAYRALNPTSKVPTLVDGDVVIWESHSILRYLAALHAPNLHGATPAERSQVERWMDWLLATLNGPYVAVFKDAKNPPEQRAADFADQCKTLIEALSLLDGRLAKRQWLALDRLTLAEIALAPLVKRCLGFPIQRPPLPALEKWQAAIDARPAFQVATGAKPSALTTAA